MKISCQSCQAKYTIADEKVLGKIVKIRCKKCGATIVINGNEAQAADGGSSDQVFDYTAQAGSEQWTVNVNDGDQRTLGVAEIVAEFRGGVINDETFCWKDGMGDWLPLREIPALHAACSLGPRLSLSPDLPVSGYGGTHDPMSHSAPARSDVGGGSGAGALFASADADSTEEQPTAIAHSNGNGSHNGLFGDASPAAPPVAARRQGGRGGGGADLFGGVAQAGGEEDVMTSAPVGSPASHGGDSGKLTGQRNENSALFSLSALTEKESKGSAAPVPQGDGSGLIDIRALSQNMSPAKPEGSSHVDDIMNLGGGGAFSAALAAPILAPPPMGMSDADIAAGGTQQGGGKGKTIVFAAIGGIVFLLMLVTIIVLVTKKPAVDPTVAANMGSANPALPAASAAGTPGPGDPTANQALAMNDTPPTTPGAGSGKEPLAAAPGTGGAVPVKAGATPPKPGLAAAPRPNNNAVAPTPDPTPAVTPPPAAPKNNSLEDELKKAAGNTGGNSAPAAAPASTAPFDRGAAAASLGAVNVGACKKGDGPTGSGHVSVTFAPTGSVVTAVVDGPPFAGTPVGGCVASKYRGARVPAFGGGNVKVGKSFSIN